MSTDLVSTDLVSADLVSADLVSADLVSAEIVSADFVSADLVSADLASGSLCNHLPILLTLESNISSYASEVTAPPKLHRKNIRNFKSLYLFSSCSSYNFLYSQCKLKYCCTILHCEKNTKKNRKKAKFFTDS